MTLALDHHASSFSITIDVSENQSRNTNVNDAPTYPTTYPLRGVLGPDFLSSSSVLDLDERLFLVSHFQPEFVVARTVSLARVDGLADPATVIQIVRDAFRFSITDIARWIGVSRPTVYSWRDGKTTPDNDTHRERLRALGRYARLFEREGVQQAHAILRARFFDGESALDLMDAGRLQQEHVAQLAQHEAAREEEHQRSLTSVRNNTPTDQWSLDTSLPSCTEEQD